MKTVFLLVIFVLSHGAHATAGGCEVFRWWWLLIEEVCSDVDQLMAGSRTVIDDIDMGGVVPMTCRIDEVETSARDVLDVNPAEDLIRFNDPSGPSVAQIGHN